MQRATDITAKTSRTGRGIWVSRPPAALLIPGLIVAVLVLLPLVYLFMRTVGAGPELWDLLWRPRTFQILGRTLALVIAVTGVSLLFCLPLAWLTTRTDLPARRVWSILTVVPLVIPSYVAGFVIIAAFGPRGMLQQTLGALFGVERLPEIYGLPGAMLAIALVTYPYLLLPLQVAMQNLDPSFEEASRSLGRDARTTFRRIILPQLRPAIAVGAILVALYTLKDFGAVSLLRYETFTWAIYLQYQTSFDRVLAAGLSVVLALLAVIILVIEAQTRGRARYHRATVGVTRQPRRFALGPWRLPALAFCGMVVLMTLVLPVSVLVYWLVTGFNAMDGLAALWKPLLSSGYVSGAAALVTLLAAIPVAFLSVRHKGLFSSFLERTTYVGFALPGIVVALALVFFGANYATPLYQTVALLVFAYLILFLPEGVGAVRSSLLQVSPRMEEASRTLGRNGWQTMATLTLPMVKPGLIAGAAMVFLTTMKELPATLLLSPIGFKTLAISVWSATSEGFFARAAIPALLLIAVASVPMAFLVVREKRQHE